MCINRVVDILFLSNGVFYGVLWIYFLFNIIIDFYRIVYIWYIIDIMYLELGDKVKLLRNIKNI